MIEADAADTVEDFASADVSVGREDEVVGLVTEEDPPPTLFTTVLPEIVMVGIVELGF